MPFRNGFDDVYEQSTLELLQSIFDSVWPAISEAPNPVSRGEVARRILMAYRAGNSLEQIKQSVLNSIVVRP
jgi:hypothetical protein